MCHCGGHQIENAETEHLTVVIDYLEGQDLLLCPLIPQTVHLRGFLRTELSLELLPEFRVDEHGGVLAVSCIELGVSELGRNDSELVVSGDGLGTVGLGQVISACNVDAQNGLI